MKRIFQPLEDLDFWFSDIYNLRTRLQYEHREATKKNDFKLMLISGFLTDESYGTIQQNLE